MTVNTTNITSGPYVGNDLNDTYSYTFRVEDKTQLSVYETTDLGVQTLLTVDTDYTVNDVGVDAGGTIVRTAGNLPTDYIWYIRSNYVENQLTDFSSQGAFFPDIHEAQMDHLTFLVQQLSDKLKRSFALADFIDIDGTFHLAQDAAARAGQFLVFDGSGDITIASGTGADSALRTDLASPAAGKGASLIAFESGEDVQDLASIAIDDGTKGFHLVSYPPVFGETGITDYGYEWADINRFGPTADGVADDSTVFGNAITSAPTGGEIKLHAKTYLLAGNSVSITKSLKIKGAPGTILKLETTTSSEKLIAVSGSGSVVEFDNITFDVNQLVADTWTNIMLNIDGVSEIRIKSNCRFINSAAIAFPAANNGYGVYMNGAFGKIIIESGVQFEYHRYAVITEPSSTGRQIKVGAANFENLAGDGVEINVPTGSCEDILINGPSFKNIGSNTVGRGFGVGASGASGTTIKRLKVVHCDFDSVDNQGIHIEDGVKEVISYGHTFKDCGTASATSLGAAIYVAATAAGKEMNSVYIGSNHIIGAANSDYGVYVGGSVVGERLTIEKQNIDGIGNGNGVFVGSVWEEAFVEYNTVKNCVGVGIVYKCKQGRLKHNRCFDDQGIKTQTYGTEIDTGGERVDIGDNDLTGNINKGYLKTSFTYPINVTNDTDLESGIEALTAAYSDWTDHIYLGVAARGTIYFNAYESTNRSTFIWLIDWDGTTLTATEVGKENLGTLAISSTPANALQMNGNWLQGRAFNSSGGTVSVSQEIRFVGQILLK